MGGCEGLVESIEASFSASCSGEQSSTQNVISPPNRTGREEVGECNEGATPEKSAG